MSTTTLIPDHKRAEAAAKARKHLCSENLVFGLPTSWSPVTGEMTYSTTGTPTTLLCQEGHIVAGDNARATIHDNGKQTVTCRSCNQAQKVLVHRDGDKQTLADVRWYALIGELDDHTEDVANLREQRDGSRERVRVIAGLQDSRDPMVAARSKYREKIANPPEWSLTVRSPEVASRVVVWHPSLVSEKKEGVLFMCPDGEHPHVAEKTCADKRVARPDACAVCNNLCLVVGVNDMATLWPEMASRILIADPKKLLSTSDRFMARAPFICDEHPHVAGVYKTKHWALRNRDKGYCPCNICAKTALGKGVNDMTTLAPQFAEHVVVYDPRASVWTKHLEVPLICDEHGHVATTRRAGTWDKGKVECDGCSGVTPIPGFNTLDVTHPEIAQTVLVYDPTKITHLHKMPVPKLCETELYPHHGIAYASRRVIEACPCCGSNSQLVVPHINSTAAVFPELAQFRDASIDATQERANSTRDAQLTCPECGEDVAWNPSSKSNRRWLKEGSLCSTCNQRNKRGGYNDQADVGLFYYDTGARVTERPRLKLIHFGITGRDLHERVKEHAHVGISTSDSIVAVEARPALVAKSIEKTVLRSTRQQRNRLELTRTAMHTDGEREHRRDELVRQVDALNSAGKPMTVQQMIEAAHDHEWILGVTDDPRYWSKATLPTDWLPEIVQVASLDEVPEGANVARARHPLPRIK